MKISVDQEALLDKFTCELLTDGTENIEAINDFVSDRGTLLVKYLQDYGKDEAEKGETIYYVIKSPNQKIVMFFSLKCGLLFRPFEEESLRVKAKEKKRELNRLDRLLADDGIGWLKIDLESKVDEVIKSIREHYEKGITQILTTINAYEEDIEKEVNKILTRARNTHAGIEMVHFCTEDSSKELWRTYQKDYGIQYPLGQVMFWKFIVPKFIEVQKIAGCEYAYLFAADTSPNADLVNYYNVALKYEQNDELGTIKPCYDFCCYFMCQKINKLSQFRDEFFENFNPDYGVPVV